MEQQVIKTSKFIDETIVSDYIHRKESCHFTKNDTGIGGTYAVINNPNRDNIIFIVPTIKLVEGIRVGKYDNNHSWIDYCSSEHAPFKTLFVRNDHVIVTTIDQISNNFEGYKGFIRRGYSLVVDEMHYYIEAGFRSAITAKDSGLYEIMKYAYDNTSVHTMTATPLSPHILPNWMNDLSVVRFEVDISKQYVNQRYLFRVKKKDDLVKLAVETNSTDGGVIAVISNSAVFIGSVLTHLDKAVGNYKVYSFIGTTLDNRLKLKYKHIDYVDNVKDADVILLSSASNAGINVDLPADKVSVIIHNAISLPTKFSHYDIIQSLGRFRNGYRIAYINFDAAGYAVEAKEDDNIAEHYDLDFLVSGEKLVKETDLFIENEDMFKEYIESYEIGYSALDITKDGSLVLPNWLSRIEEYIPIVYEILDKNPFFISNIVKMLKVRDGVGVVSNKELSFILYLHLMRSFGIKVNARATAHAIKKYGYAEWLSGVVDMLNSVLSVDISATTSDWVSAHKPKKIDLILQNYKEKLGIRSKKDTQLTGIQNVIVADIAYSIGYATQHLSAPLKVKSKDILRPKKQDKISGLVSVWGLPLRKKSATTYYIEANGNTARFCPLTMNGVKIDDRCFDCTVWEWLQLITKALQPESLEHFNRAVEKQIYFEKMDGTLDKEYLSTYAVKRLKMVGKVRVDSIDRQSLQNKVIIPTRKHIKKAINEMVAAYISKSENIGFTRKHREYNAFVVVGMSLIRELFGVVLEIDIQAAFISLIAAVLGLHIDTDTIYENLMDSLHISRAEAKKRFNKVLNDHYGMIDKDDNYTKKFWGVIDFLNKNGGLPMEAAAELAQLATKKGRAYEIGVKAEEEVIGAINDRLREYSSVGGHIRRHDSILMFPADALSMDMFETVAKDIVDRGYMHNGRKINFKVK